MANGAEGGGRPPKHGGEFRFARPETWGEPDAATVQVTDRYGAACAMAWDRIHPRLTTRSAWIDHTAELPLSARMGQSAGVVELNGPSASLNVCRSRWPEPGSRATQPVQLLPGRYA